MHLVDDLGDRREPSNQETRQFKAEVESVRADMKEQVTGGRHSRMPAPADLSERMKLGRALATEHAVPQLGPYPRHAAELALRDPKAHRSPQSTDIREQIPYHLLSLRMDRQDQEDRRLGQRRQNGLGIRCAQGAREPVRPPLRASRRGS